MYQCIPITDVFAREILDSRGNPTIEVEVLAGESYLGRAAVPSGASTGKYEAVELRDKDCRYHGKGVKRAVDHVNAVLAPEIIGMNVLDQIGVDKALIKKDGTKNKENLGANAILGISLAVARAGAKAMGQSLYAYLGGVHARKLPIPMMNILNGGRHADNSVDFQELMIMPVGANSMKEAIRMCAEVYAQLKDILKKKGLQTAVGDEGGFAPDFADTKEALRTIMNAVSQAGYEKGKDIVIAIDAAASEFYNKEFKKYVFEGESKMQGERIIRSTEEMIDYYADLIEEFPIVSIEDPLDEEDWEGWELLTTRLGNEVQLVGDDLFVTNSERLSYGIDNHAANAILIKVNQIGTLTESLHAIEIAKNAGYNTIISHRSGETEDTFIADLAVACNAGQIKTGAPCRGERTAKYNQLLRIEEYMGENSEFPKDSFKMLAR